MHTDVDIEANLEPLSLLLSRFRKLHKTKYSLLSRDHEYSLTSDFPTDLTFEGQSPS